MISVFINCVCLILFTAIFLVGVAVYILMQNIRTKAELAAFLWSILRRLLG